MESAHGARVRWPDAFAQLDSGFPIAFVMPLVRGRRPTVV